MAASYTTTKSCKWKPRKVSAKRDFPAAFKEQKAIEVRKDSADKEVPDFIPLESCGSDHNIIPRIVTEMRGLDTGDGDNKNAELDAHDITPRVFNIITCDLDNVDGDEIAESSNCGIIPCTVGTGIRGSDTINGDGGRDEVAKLGNNTELKAIKSGFGSYKQRRVSAVRDFPPGCGPASVCS